MILVNTETITGKNLEMLGLVKGSTIQTKNIGRDISQSFKTLVGGELKAYTEMMNDARALATKRMVAEAEALGADAALLICALMDEQTLENHLKLCEELGLAALVETHDEREIGQAVAAGARIIGVNNRNLKDFSVDFSNAARLRDRIPPECIYVAESGVKGPEDARLLRRIGADAVLVGETLMRASDPGEVLASLREAAR